MGSFSTVTLPIKALKALLKQMGFVAVQLCSLDLVYTNVIINPRE